jgi:hypothetical protein
MFAMNTLESGGLIILLCSLVAAGLVLVMRWFTDHRVLIQNKDFVSTT